jgi:hypothetical protein
VTSLVEITTYDMERPAVLPVAAPVGAVAPGFLLAVADPYDNHGSAVPSAFGKPWIAGNDRQIGRRFRPMTGRSARRLGGTST